LQEREIVFRFELLFYLLVELFGVGDDFIVFRWKGLPSRARIFPVQLNLTGVYCLKVRRGATETDLVADIEISIRSKRLVREIAENQLFSEPL